MPQLANAVLTDRAATPVNHTFTPLGIQGNTALLVESTGIPVGDNKLNVSWSTTPAGRRNATVKVSLPIVQTQVINGISTPVVVRTARAEATFSFDPTSTEQERKDAVGMLASGLAPGIVLINDTVTKLQGIY